MASKTLDQLPPFRGKEEFEIVFDETQKEIPEITEGSSVGVITLVKMFADLKEELVELRKEVSHLDRSVFYGFGIEYEPRNKEDK